MDLHLRGKSVLITGASKGIGAAAAGVFAEEGCNLHLAARSEAALEALAQRLTAEHGVTVAVHAVDLRESDAIDLLAVAVAEADILVNNAGDVPGGSLEVIDEATWVFHALADSTRRAILRDITRGTKSVGEIAKPFPMSLAAVSKHLDVLERATLIRRERQGKSRMVSLNPHPLEAAQDWLAFYNQYWSDGLDRLQATLENKEQ